MKKRSGLFKWYYDENRTFPIKNISKDEQVVCIRIKMLFPVLKYLFVLQILKFLKYEN